MKAPFPTQTRTYHQLVKYPALIAGHERVAHEPWERVDVSISVSWEVHDGDGVSDHGLLHDEEVRMGTAQDDGVS